MTEITTQEEMEKEANEFVTAILERVREDCIELLRIGFEEVKEIIEEKFDRLEKRIKKLEKKNETTNK